MWCRFWKSLATRGSPASGATPSELLKPMPLGRVTSTGAAASRRRIGRAPPRLGNVRSRGSFGRRGWPVEPARHRSPRPRTSPSSCAAGSWNTRGVAGRAHPRLRFMPPAQAPIPVGRLLDGQLGQRERLQPLIRNGPTAQHRGTVGARRQTSLRSLEGATGHAAARPGLAGLQRPAPSTGSTGLDTVTASSWSRDTARPSCSSRRRSCSNRARARALSTLAPHPPLPVGITVTAPVRRTQSGI
jgi:hypothetical protein